MTAPRLLLELREAVVDPLHREEGGESVLSRVALLFAEEDWDGLLRELGLGRGAASDAVREVEAKVLAWAKRDPALVFRAMLAHAASCVVTGAQAHERGAREALLAYGLEPVEDGEA